MSSWIRRAHQYETIFWTLSSISVDGRRGELFVGWGIKASHRHAGAELEVCLFFAVIVLALQVKRDFLSFYKLLKAERFKTQNLFIKRKTTILTSGKQTSAQFVSDWDLRRVSKLINKICIS